METNEFYEKLGEEEWQKASMYFLIFSDALIPNNPFIVMCQCQRKASG